MARHLSPTVPSTPFHSFAHLRKHRAFSVGRHSYQAFHLSTQKGTSKYMLKKDVPHSCIFPFVIFSCSAPSMLMYYDPCICRSIHASRSLLMFMLSFGFLIGLLLYLILGMFVLTKFSGNIYPLFPCVVCICPLSWMFGRASD